MTWSHVVIIAIAAVRWKAFGSGEEKWSKREVQAEFRPRSLSLLVGDVHDVYVNVWHQRDQPLYVDTCCLKPDVAQLVTQTLPRKIASDVKHVFNVTVRALGLGRTRLRLLRGLGLTTYSSSVTERRLQFEGVIIANVSSAKRQLLAAELPITVSESESNVDDIIRYVVISFNMLVMVFSGAQLDGQACAQLLRTPWPLVPALVSKYALVPPMALGVVLLLGLDRDQSLGLLTLTCAPNEGSSHQMALLLHADVTYSLTFTLVSNFAALGMLPLWTIMFESKLYSRPAGSVCIPFRLIFALFASGFASVAVGYLIRKRFPRLSACFARHVRRLALLVLIFALLCEVFVNHAVLPFATSTTFGASILIVVASMLCGSVMSLTLDWPRSPVVMLEATVRSPYLVMLLLRRSLPSPDSSFAMPAPVVYCFFATVPLLLFASALAVYRSAAKSPCSRQSKAAEPPVVFAELELVQICETSI